MTRHVSRRSVLAGVGLATASAGCIGRARNIAGRERASQLTLEINAAPADVDPSAIRIARHLAENLNDVGIDARINTLGQTDLRRKVLINQEFDIYVGQFLKSEPFDPDAMYAFTHSQFIAEAGWQNPFGFTELAVDDLLTSQRRVSDSERPDVVTELQRTLCELQPFTVVAFPDGVTAVREERFEGWGTRQPLSVGGLLGLERTGATAGDDVGGTTTAGETTGGNETTTEGTSDARSATLRLVTTDEQITQNWNPIAAEYRRYGTFTSLLYDRLVLVDDGEPIPWLAADWDWIDDDTMEVTLRDARWHDGDRVTAEDVAFTYDFLQDTSMGNVETPVPAPKFRGRSSIVETATALDDTTVRLTVGDVNETVGVRALQVPILPKDVWEERTGVATIAGIAFDVDTTEAVVSTNENPIGSGPVRFVEATAEESTVFERNPDHFLVRTDPSTGDETDDGTTDPRAGIPERYHGKPAFERLEIEVMPSDISAVESVADGLADATASNLGPDAVPRIGRAAEARLVSAPSAGFYHVGYNARRAPLSNPRFRGILASLIDKDSVVEEAFDGYARPAASPLAASPEWVPDDLAWDDRKTDPVYPFIGDPGSLDVESARQRLREAGYRFDDDGRLLSHGR